MCWVNSEKKFRPTSWRALAFHFTHSLYYYQYFTVACDKLLTCHVIFAKIFVSNLTRIIPAVWQAGEPCWLPPRLHGTSACSALAAPLLQPYTRKKQPWRTFYLSLSSGTTLSKSNFNTLLCRKVNIRGIFCIFYM
jgi:hypothetical protein